MRILQVCSAETIGGGERHVIDLTRALIERGHELHLAVRPRSPLRPALAGWPVTFHELPLRNSLDLVSVWRLSRLLRTARIEVLHAHVGRDYIVAGLAARLNPPVRFLLTRHHFNPLARGSSIAGRLYAWALGRASLLIAVSETVRERLATALPTLAARIRVIPNWIEPRPAQALSRAEAREALGISRPLAIAIIGQISPLKGQDIFVASALDLLAQPDGQRLEFLLIGQPGEGDRLFAAQLAARISAAGQDAHLRLTGFIENLPAHLPAIDIVAILSANEAFSLVLVESMVAGTAIVATRVGGVAEILTADQTGLFIERTPASLTAALRRLIDDPALRQRLGAAAHAAALHRFSRDPVIDLIEEALGPPARPSVSTSPQLKA